jgi:hypothetical protein
MITWAFIYISKECNPKEHNKTIDSLGCRSIFVGVDSVDAGCEAAKKLVSEGCRIIELCGGFGKQGAKKVIEATEGAVPVGFVDYFPGDEEKVKLIFS